MSSKGQRKEPQRQILRNLSRKKAISREEINAIDADKYAINRSIKNIVGAGLAEILPSEQNGFLRITALGRQKLFRDELINNPFPINKNWDGFWRIVILNLPEERKSEREALRYLLKKANFADIKNSVWISPLPYENLFENIKKDLGLSTELMIVITNKLDAETNRAFLDAIKK